MGFKTDRMSAQDKVLNQFKHALGTSGSVENKPLTLAEQIAQADNKPIVKRVSDAGDELEKRMNDSQLVSFRSTK
jgi:uncharacterized protein YydD (DUF2326 family)